MRIYQERLPALIHLAQLGRAADILLDIYGQRFSDLSDGVTTLRTQLTGRTVHHVIDESKQPSVRAAQLQPPVRRPVSQCGRSPHPAA
ncbi:hypothetical protein ACFU96_30455 [Streptomyces sp. NPDC057620]|uniref:hypothetical protein n=1 Tax=Streptomyces sp. NPDC057620 TaxID=3346185 RepID=UPI0036B4ADA3